jgi:hypothetical protein
MTSLSARSKMLSKLKTLKQEYGKMWGGVRGTCADMYMNMIIKLFLLIKKEE